MTYNGSRGEGCTGTCAPLTWCQGGARGVTGIKATLFSF